MSRTRVHLSGWDTGFFRVAATPGNGSQQIYRHKQTGEFKPLPYDHAEKVPDSDWEPIYVYRGDGSWMALKTSELKIIHRALGKLLWGQDHTCQPPEVRQPTANLLGRISRRLAKERD